MGKAAILVSLFTFAVIGISSAQSFAPVDKMKGPFIGAGGHGLISMNQSNSSVVGLNAQYGHVWKRAGVSVSPQVNFIQVTQEDAIRSGMDVSVVLIGFYRPKGRNGRLGIGGGPMLHVTETLTNLKEWETTKKLSIVGGLGRNWTVGPLCLNLSGILAYTPHTEDFSIGADISLNYPL